MPAKRVPQDIDLAALGMKFSRFVVRMDMLEGKKRKKWVTRITACDDAGVALPYIRLLKKSDRKPPLFIMVDGMTVAMDADMLIWYCEGRVDLRKYGWPLLDEHTRNF